MSAQDKLDRRAAKHGLGSDERKRKIQKAKDFFSKPVPTYSKDELRKMGHPVESAKVPAGMKFIASYVYKDANGKEHTHRHLRKGSKMTDPVVVYIDGKEWKTFQSFTKAKQASINHIKGMKESVDLEENKIFFVKVGDGRDSMTVKTKARNSREALKKMRSEHPKSRVSLDQNQKQGQPVGALESVEEGMFDIQIPPPKGKASTAKTTARNKAKSMKHADKIKKAMAKDMAHSASGKLTKSYDPNKKKYQSGSSGRYFSKYESVELGEKAVSKSQQKFMGMVRSVQKGEMDAPSPEVAKAAKTMSKKDVKDFASTKHKGLPESSVEYGKSMDRIKDKEKNAAIKPKDRETLGKLADLMKKQKRNEAYRKPTQAEIDADKRKDGKSKDSSTRYRDMKKKMYGNAMGGLKNEEKKYSVKYTHPTDKKSGKTTGPLSKAAADKKAAMGNRVDRVGGKYTVIPHVEAAGQEFTAVPVNTAGEVSGGDRMSIAKLDAIMQKRSKDKRQKESTMADRQVVRAMRIAKDMAGNHTGATRAIEKLKKGLSDHPKVKDALRVANESVATADKKPQNYRDPETGKLMTRMVPTHQDVVRGNDKAKVVKHKKFKDVRKNGNEEV